VLSEYFRCPPLRRAGPRRVVGGDEPNGADHHNGAASRGHHHRVHRQGQPSLSVAGDTLTERSSTRSVRVSGWDEPPALYNLQSPSTCLRPALREPVVDDPAVSRRTITLALFSRSTKCNERDPVNADLTILRGPHLLPRRRCHSRRAVGQGTRCIVPSPPGPSAG